jgi:hypothetical protein
MQHQAVHAPHDVLDGREHIRLELGIVAVTLRILEHQRQLRNQVLEVVDDERRHPVERVELPRLEQRFARANLSEEARRLPDRSLQEIADLPIDVDVVRGVIST